MTISFLSGHSGNQKKCSPHEFLCENDSDQCLPYLVACDDKSDCLNGRDEKFGMCNGKCIMTLLLYSIIICLISREIFSI